MRNARWTVVHMVVFAVATGASAPIARAQTVSVAGVVIRGDVGTPVAGANVRITEGPSTTTDRDGRFRLREVSPGRAALVVQAVGYRLQVLELPLSVDTTVRIALDPVPTQLDTVRTIAGNITITGRVRDSATQERVLMGEVTVYPGARTVGILTAGFRVTNVPRGDVTLVVTGFQHLPMTISFSATRDTSIVVDLAIDSVALRMAAQQLKRLGAGNPRARRDLRQRRPDDSRLLEAVRRRSGARTTLAPHRLPGERSAAHLLGAPLYRNAHDLLVRVRCVEHRVRHAIALVVPDTLRDPPA